MVALEEEGCLFCRFCRLQVSQGNSVDVHERSGDLLRLIHRDDIVELCEIVVGDLTSGARYWDLVLIYQRQIPA
jgi:hypothetical protein